jgi:hypothetical protein
MLADDTETAIEQAASEFTDEEVTQFADPNRIAGKGLAESLGAANGIAWDIYMFYESTARWTSSPPEPTDWVHQLAPSSWTPPERYRCGCSDDLTESLRRLAAQTGREASEGQRGAAMSNPHSITGGVSSIESREWATVVDCPPKFDDSQRDQPLG